MNQINQDVLARTVRYLRDKGIMDQEDVHYKISKFPVTSQEFDDLIGDLVDIALNKDAVREIESDEDDEEGFGGMFGESRTSFRYLGLNFTLNTLFGQGSVTTLFRHDYNPEYCPFVNENVVDLEEVLSKGG